jgi:hypothetical protein
LTRGAICAIVYTVKQKGIQMTTYFGLAFSANMLPLEACDIHSEVVDITQSLGEIQEAEICLNPSHKATIDVLNPRFGIEVKIPQKAPIVALKPGDVLLVLQVSGLPRLGGDRKEYTPEEIEGADFNLRKFTIS